MLSIYLHIPFCLSKCGYCDFFSVPLPDPAFAAYPELLLTQLQMAARKPEWIGPVHSVYFGGGTPSLLHERSVASLLAAIDQHFSLTADAEISLEANPGTLTLNRLQGYRAAGINRLSLGIQTLNDPALQWLGRRHTHQESLQAIALARKAGFDNLSLDLMFALPGQTLKDLQHEIDAYLQLGPQHLSCYGLTAEPGTPLGTAVASGQAHLPEEDLYADAFLCLHERLEAAGYQHYEIANYALPDVTCRHNLGYWRRQACLGLGASAHSFCPIGWGERRAVTRSLAAYRSVLHSGQDPAKTLEIFDRSTAMAETLYLGLRTREGVSEDLFRDRFEAGVAEAFPAAVAGLADDLLFTSGCWHFRPEKWLLFDCLIQSFL